MISITNLYQRFQHNYQQQLCRDDLWEQGFLPANERWLVERWLIGLSLGFALVAAVIYLSGTNVQLFLAFNQQASRWPGAFWQSVTFMGDTLPALSIGLLLAIKRPQWLWAITLAALIGALYTHGLKNLFGVLRPPSVLDPALFNIIGPAIKRLSFPSGHTLTAFTLAAILCFYFRSRGLGGLFMLVALLAGVSRIAVGVHWPLDVCLGAFGGLLSACLGVRLAKKHPWGLRPGVFLVLFSLYWLSAWQLFNHDGGYPQAAWLAKSLSVISCGVGAWYLLRLCRPIATTPGQSAIDHKPPGA